MENSPPNAPWPEARRPRGALLGAMSVVSESVGEGYFFGSANCDSGFDSDGFDSDACIGD